MRISSAVVTNSHLTRPILIVDDVNVRYIYIHISRTNNQPTKFTRVISFFVFLHPIQTHTCIIMKTNHRENFLLLLNI